MKLVIYHSMIACKDTISQVKTCNMAPTTIRPRTPEDLNACIQLLHRVYAVDKYPVHGVSNARAFLTFSHLELAFVAESQGEIIGHVAIGKASDADIAAKLWRTQHPETEVAVLMRLFVDPEHRGSGISGKLIETAVKWNGERGRRLILFVLEKDPGAERLYRRLGWENFGTGMHWYGEGKGESMEAKCFVSPA